VLRPHVDEHLIGADIELDNGRVGGLLGGHGEVLWSRILDEAADRFRGEAVLLVSHGGIIELGLSHLARNVTAGFVDHHPLDNGGVVEVEVDSSGWVCTSWAGEPVGAQLQA
jgi:probable phosphoglycerate mutase